MVCYHLKYSFIFLHEDAEGFPSVPEGLHLITWVVLSFLNVWIPHKVQTISLTSTMSPRGFHEKKAKRKLQYAAKSQAISGSISVISYAVWGGLLDAKVNQVVPCFSIIWKSRGSLDNASDFEFELYSNWCW